MNGARASLFGILVGATCLVQVHVLGPAAAESTNRDRVSTDRGQILSSDGVVLATSEGGSRVYPLDGFTADVTGSITAGYGADGVEAIADQVLAGTTTTARAATLAQLLPDSRTTGDVDLTIDSTLQVEAMRGLGGRPGAAVVMDVETGAILALVTSTGESSEVLRPGDRVPESATSVLRVGSAFMDVFFPGSTFKIVILDAAIRYGLAAPDTMFPVEQAFGLDDWTNPVTNYGDSWCGGTLAESFARSCNTVFARLAVELGPRRLTEQMQRFGFGVQVPIDLPGAVGSPLIDLYGLEAELLARVGFGAYEVQVSPLHLTSIVSAIGNDGLAMRPRVLATTPPEPWLEMTSAEVAGDVLEMMREVARSGTARSLSTSCGVPIAAKTGTAGFGSADDPRTHAWTTALAPADDPKIAVTVFLHDSPETRHSTGSQLAGPLVADLIDLTWCSAIHDG